MIKKAKEALENQTPVVIETPIKNTNRSVGAMLSGAIAKKYGMKGLKDDTIHIKLKGISGQSFGAFTAKGVTLELEGESNDYVGKGLSGGKIIVRPDPSSKIVPEDSIITGNTVLYGAVGGETYFRGVAGERFAVRNSGAISVVEGCGDHGLEYMTGGCVVIIGDTGRNFAAGMSGGIAYVLDEKGDFAPRCNLSMVELETIYPDKGLKNISEEPFDILADMGCDDHIRLVTMLENHVKYTGSTKAKMILQNMDQYLSKFVKIMPTEYKRALKEMASAQTTLSAYIA